MRKTVVLGLVMGMSSAVAIGCGSESDEGADAATTSSSSSGGAGSSSSSGSGSSVTVEPVAVACTVVVRDDHGNPVHGVAVVVNNAAGAIVSARETAADGSSLALVPAGGMVTAFDVEDHHLTAMSAVDPPDGSVFNVSIARGLAVAPVAAPRTTYHVAAATAPVGTADYVVSTSCGSTVFTAEEMTVTIEGGCSGAATEEFLLVARDANEKPLAWASATMPTQPGKDGGDVALAPDKTAFVAFDGSITSIPAAATHARIEVHPSGVAGLRLLGATAKMNAAAGSLELHDLEIPGFATSYLVKERIDLGDAQKGAWVMRTRGYQALPASTTFAADSMGLVWIQPMDESDVARPSVNWVVSAGPRGDVGMTELGWTNGAFTASWEALFAPSSATSIRLPDLPAGYDAFRPGTTTAYSEAQAGYVDQHVYGPYADFLAVPLMTAAMTASFAFDTKL